MKTAPKLYSVVIRLTGACLLLTALIGCELPPREAWKIVQRDGLLTYMGRQYNPPIAPSRYLVPNGTPFMPSPSPQVPYRPRSPQSRYLVTNSDTVYRPKPKRVSRPKPSMVETAETTPPKIPLEPSQAATTPKSPKPEADKPSMETLPYGTPVTGRPGMVNSPFAEKQQLVDVTGMAPGEAVKDPYTGKLFRVPPTQQAAAEKTEPPPHPATEEAKTQP